MQRHDQCGKIALLHVLNFVDQQHDRSLALLRGLCDGYEKIGEIDCEIAGGCGRCETEIDIADGRFEHCCERTQRTERLLHIGAGFFDPVEPMQDVLQLRRELLRERLVRIDFEQGGLAALALGDSFEVIEQHRLADAAQTQHQRALRRPARLGAHHGDPCVLDQFVPPGQFRGRDAGAGVVWIERGLHRIVRLC